MRNSAIFVKDLNFSYGNKKILHSLNLSIKKGSLCGLLGPNGSGKTTFFKCCLNFLKASGEIYINEQNSLKFSPSTMAKNIAYVPQDNEISFDFTALEIVLMGRTPHIKGIFGLNKKDYEISLRIMAKIGIEYLKDNTFNALSGGQRQLILIARALVQETPIIILDEPTSALDFKNQILVWKILKEVVKTGITVIVCTHEPNHILWFCDDIIAFENGRVLSQGKVKDVINQNFLHKIYEEDFYMASINQQSIIYPKLYS